jgi:hypothetical protein
MSACQAFGDWGQSSQGRNILELHGIAVVLYSEKVGNIPALHDCTLAQKKHETCFDDVCLSEIVGSPLDKWCSLNVTAFGALIGPNPWFVLVMFLELVPPSSAVPFRKVEQINHRWTKNYPRPLILLAKKTALETKACMHCFLRYDLAVTGKNLTNLS